MLSCSNIFFKQIVLECIILSINQAFSLPDFLSYCWVTIPVQFIGRLLTYLTILVNNQFQPLYSKLAADNLTDRLVKVAFLQYTFAFLVVGLLRILHLDTFLSLTTLPISHLPCQPIELLRCVFYHLMLLRDMHRVLLFSVGGCCSTCMYNDLQN